MKRPDLSERNTTHGLSKHPLYPTWKAMKNRCNNKNNAAYRHYGERGINVCDRWSNDFQKFLGDMGEKPTLKHTIERIDNNKGYSPDNCKWASMAVQVRNKRIKKTNKTGIDGIFCFDRYLVPKWQVTIGNNYTNIHLGFFSDFFEACCARKSAENKYWLNF